MDRTRTRERHPTAHAQRIDLGRPLTVVITL
jgi:hypothetical protein